MVSNIWNRYVESAASRYGVPPSLINSVISAESSGRPDAVSRVGAGGLMQLMPDTFAELRQKHGLGSDRFDPATNINAGTAYLGHLYRQFGNWNDAISAYNAGPNRWRQVKAGEREAPRETVDYTKKVTDSFGRGQAGQTGGAEVPLLFGGSGGMPSPPTGNGPLFSGQRAATEEEAQRWMNSAFGGGLLDFGPDKNFYEGLGLLSNTGQTSSQPPRPEGAVADVPRQTDRLDINDTLNRLLQPTQRDPRPPMMGPGGYMLAGATNAVGQLAGVRDRKVGIGELLGALGGGLFQGGLAGQQAQRQQRADERAETGEQFDNVYKYAAARKALAPDSEAKVVPRGGAIFHKGQWQRDPNAGPDQGGPLEGTGIDAQMTNVYVMLEQKRARGEPLTQQEQLLYGTAQRHLMKPKLVTGPDGVVREVAPEPLPTLDGPAAAAAPPPGAAAPLAPIGQPSPAGSLIDPPAPAAAPPAQTGSRVTEVVPPVPKEIPATAQTAMLGNVAALRKLSGALDELKKAPGATGYGPGLFNLLPGQTVNRVMPEGARARADIADIGSMIIHDRSGAAVTVGEMEKLKPFIPTVFDDAASAQMKINRLQIEIEEMLRDYSQTYSADSNFKENPVVREALAAIRPRAPMEGAGSGGGAGGAKVMRFDGQGNLIQ